jgi:hypothetical protein
MHERFKTDTDCIVSRKPGVSGGIVSPGTPEKFFEDRQKGKKI